MAVYSLGSNGSGQLGVGHLDDISSLERAVLPDSVSKSMLHKIVAGGNHTLLLTSSGSILAAGCNEDGRCGFSSTCPESSSFLQVTLLQDDHSATVSIKLCAATWEASVLVTTDNHVFTMGSGHKGELGQGMEVKTSQSPRVLPSFCPSGIDIIDVAACMGHVVVVLSNGEVWGWGNGLHGQLGQPAAVVWAPRKIEGVSFKAVRAVCGKDFTCVFESPIDGKLAVIGLDKRDRFSLKQGTPVHVRGWSDVQASWGGVYVLFQSGELLAWGRNDHGQLPPPGLPRLRSVSAGSEHVVALTETKKVLAWGWGEHGNCGEPTDDRCDVKGHYNVLSVETECLAVGSGCATSWIVT